jgi:cellobiose phosphorylase
VAFTSRYEADKLYREIIRGNIKVRGGWRVYSSGPGIFISLIVTRLLGIRIEFGKVILDPVIPYSMDGLEASMVFRGHQVTFRYRTNEDTYGPKSLDINGKMVRFSREENKYRLGGAAIPLPLFLESLDQQENVVEIGM